MNKPVLYRPQELSKRLGEKKVAELARRAEAGESVRSLARELDVANSALTRMLRAQGVTIQKRTVSDDEAAAMAKKYEAGATMREIEGKHGLSHGAVLRSLHRSGVTMRAKARRHEGADSSNMMPQRREVRTEPRFSGLDTATRRSA